MNSPEGGSTADVRHVGATMAQPAKRPEKRYTVARRVPGTGVLRGRTEEMTTALRMLRATAQGGHGQIMIITGEPGMGKSELA
ncbi:ATP-binding protein, partial [Streptomyces sp. NPDC060223]